jgi:hypothetical protein
MTPAAWYTEKYGPTDTEARWSERLPDFAAVRATILEVRRLQTGEIVRVIAPHCASVAELQALRAMGFCPS